MRASRGMGAMAPGKLDKPCHADGGWIRDAVNPKNRNALSRSLGVKKGVVLPKGKLKTPSMKMGSIGKKARPVTSLKKI